MEAYIYHLVCDVVVRHIDGTYLLMKRDLNKKGWPGMYQVGAGGSALKGESPIECAMRELKEESGIICDDLVEIYHIVRDMEHSIYHGYLCVTDSPKDSIILQESETIAYKWVSKEEFVMYMDSDECIDTQKIRLKEFIDSLR